MSLEELPNPLSETLETTIKFNIEVNEYNVDKKSIEELKARLAENHNLDLQLIGRRTQLREEKELIHSALKEREAK